MKNFLKGILCGIGGVIPGLSGSVLLVIFGLYEKTIKAIGTIFKDFKANLFFLIPLFCGFGLGIIGFSKVIDAALSNFEIITRFVFFGLILGTLPAFYGEVRKYGYQNKYYLMTVLAIIVGIVVFYVNGGLFSLDGAGTVTSFVIGCVVALASIVPGLDSASTLSALGLYEVYVKALADFDIVSLVPMALGLGSFALVLSYFMNKLLDKHYTATFSFIFGLFICMAPKVITPACISALHFDISLVGYVLCVILGFVISYLFSHIEEIIDKTKKLYKDRQK